MKRSLFLSLNILSLVFMLLGTSRIFAQSKNGICFMPEDKEHEECIDFSKVWYYSVPLATGWVLYVRNMNSDALPYIWDKGQYLVSKEEYEKIKQALASKGLSGVCPHPDFRTIRDRLKSRAEMCKK